MSESQGRIRLRGRLVCACDAEAALVAQWLPEHIRLTRAEPGCLRFEVVQGAGDPRIWLVDEEFTDRAAFDAHQVRTRDSAWYRASKAVRREFTLTED